WIRTGSISKQYTTKPPQNSHNPLEDLRGRNVVPTARCSSIRKPRRTQPPAAFGKSMSLQLYLLAGPFPTQSTFLKQLTMGRALGGRALHSLWEGISLSSSGVCIRFNACRVLL